jgi:hypothetical protein
MRRYVVSSLLTLTLLSPCLVYAWDYGIPTPYPTPSASDRIREAQEQNRQWQEQTNRMIERSQQQQWQQRQQWQQQQMLEQLRQMNQRQQWNR